MTRLNGEDLTQHDETTYLVNSQFLQTRDKEQQYTESNTQLKVEIRGAVILHQLRERL